MKCSFYGACYSPPAQLPGGFWDALGPLAEWVKGEIRNAYSDGYLAGRVDAARQRACNRDGSEVS